MYKLHKVPRNKLEIETSRLRVHIQIYGKPGKLNSNADVLSEIQSPEIKLIVSNPVYQMN